MERDSLKQKFGGRLMLALRLMVAVFAAAALLVGTSSCDMLDKLPFFGKKAAVRKPTRRRAKRKKKVKKKADVTMKALKEEPVYVYQPKGKVDPFMPFLRGFAKPKPKPGKPKVPEGPLQKIDLADFTLVAVVWGNFGRKALVQDLSGKGYIIKKGTLIGRNNGSVKDILKDKLIVEEEREDALGNAVRVPVELRLPKTPPEIQGAISGPTLSSGEETAEEGGEEAKSPQVEIPTPEE